MINGRWQRLHIVGLALAPDFVVEYAGSAMVPDNRRYGVLWTSADGLETAFDMKGTFNDAVVRYGAVTGPLQRDPWGSSRFVRVAGPTPYDDDWAYWFHFSWRYMPSTQSRISRSISAADSS